jgi:hypothetical protein
MFDKFKIVPVAVPIDTTGAAITQDVINMENYDRVCFVVQFGNVAANCGANLILTEATDVAKTGAAAIAARYRLSSVFPSDTFSDWAALASTGLAIAAATHDNMTVLIEFDAIDFSAGYSCIYPTFTGGAGATLISCIAILTGARYAPDMTAIA